MAPKNVLLALLPACSLFLGPAVAAQQLTVLMTFDSERIGPAVGFDGELRVSGGRITVFPWMHDGDDAVDGAAFRLTSEHTAESAAAARLARAYRSTLAKGLLLEIDAHAAATLSGTTTLGDFQVPLEELRPEQAVPLLDGKARLEVIPNVTALSGDAAEEEYPSLAVLPDGDVAVCCVAWDGKTDRLVLRLGQKTRTLAEGGEYLDPRCCVDGQGRLSVVWTENDGSQWDLWAYGEGRTRKLTTGPRNDFWPRLARDRQGRVWLAWQTVGDDLDYEVMLARLTADGLSEVVNVSDHPHDDWEPAICSTADGRIVVAWDSYRNGSYDVYLRQFTAADGAVRPLGTPQAVAATAKREAHATLAADGQGRVWIAWDVSFENWGKHPEGGGTLHSDRSSDVACLADGRIRRPAAGFMESLPQPYRQFVEYPLVAVDGQDRLWVVFRMENRVHPFYTAGGRRAQSYGMWHLFATQYDGKGWTEPVLLAASNGRQDVRPDAAVGPGGGLLVVFAADGRTRRLPYMPVDYDVHLASLAGFGEAAAAVELADAGDLGRVEPAEPDPELMSLPRQWEVGSKRYRLVIGDTHRHTDISRCANGRDGSLQDAYRYAIDCCGLDWLAISDHDQDILKHRNDRDRRPRQDYDWWRSQKCCDLYTIPGRFVALYGYEHGGSYQARGGHKNIVYAERGVPVYEEDAPHELFAVLADSGALAIPHQLADGGSRTDWDKWNEQFERVGEIFQTRGSYEYQGCPREASTYTEGHSMWDALAKGVRIGIIASSDHGQTHQARAGAYVEEPPGEQAEFTRQGILEALKARRAFGATVAVAMQVSVAGHPLGREITLDESPTIEARVTAPAPIAQLEVVRDNRFVYAKRPGTQEAVFTFQDLDLRPGQTAYYYVRAQIGENDYAWSSPIWVTRSN